MMPCWPASSSTSTDLNYPFASDGDQRALMIDLYRFVMMLASK